MSYHDKLITPQKKNNSRSKQAPIQRSSNPANIIQRIRMYPQSMTHADAMALQRTIGNQAVCQLMREIGLMKGQTVQKKESKTGLPDSLKAGVENLSGLSMDDVRIHYNSDKPAQVGALAYTQGADIHVAPGQERHLPHEAWHVVQQAQGRVQPTMQLKGIAVNDDEGLEKEAEEMNERIRLNCSKVKADHNKKIPPNLIIQRATITVSPDQYSIVETAISLACRYILGALRILNTIKGDSLFINRYVSGYRTFKIWFGEVEDMRSHIEKVITVYLRALNTAQSVTIQNYQQTLQHQMAGVSGREFAFTTVDGPIYLSQRFYQLGIAQKALTVLHELTHAAADTEDYELTSDTSISAARDLALSSPTYAINCAYNFEHFAEVILRMNGSELTSIGDEVEEDEDEEDENEEDEVKKNN